MYKNALIFLLSILILRSDSGSQKKKFILYDVNPGEGFNLRRDVFMRIAILVRKLNLASPDTTFTLVLPPWGHLYHWQTRKLGIQNKILWSVFFDVKRINNFVPVIEFSDFLSKEGSQINMVYYLQGYEGGWKDGKFEEKFKVSECLSDPVYQKDENGLYEGFFWDYMQVRADQFECLSVQGATRVLHKFLEESGDASIMLDRAENLLHDHFGDVNYWGVRRSMRFANHLVQISNQFRLIEFSSSDELDDTMVHKDWRDHRAGRRGRGGPYACVHLRRKDYVKARQGQIPSIEGGAAQVEEKLKSRGLKNLYVATDAPDKEFREFRSHLKGYNVVKYRPSDKDLQLYKDGGVAIIDQLICSHASYFIGSFESTFTFRIQEEREILGFPLKSTFDMLCADGKQNCEKGSQWKIDWGKPDQDWSLNSNGVHTEL